MSDILNTLCSRPVSEEERKNLLSKNKVLGIYNKALVIFDAKEHEFWALLDTKRIQLTKSEVSKLGISTKGCVV